MDDFEEIRAEIPHQLPELPLARADIGDELCALDRVGGRCGAGVEENVAFDIHKSLPIHKTGKDKRVVPVMRQFEIGEEDGEIMRSSKALEEGAAVE